MFSLEAATVFALPLTPDVEIELRPGAHRVPHYPQEGEDLHRERSAQVDPAQQPEGGDLGLYL